MLTLSRKGYGSYRELLELDTDDLLDLIEFEKIATAIESHEVNHGRRK